MTGTDHIWHHLAFKLKIHEASGEQFQGLFSQLFKWTEAGFQSIAPWGNLGDDGNDGWIPSAGHYFQVYGPHSSTTVNPVFAVNKVVVDFKKLLASWKGINKYTFVYNDHFRGAPAPVAIALKKLQEDHKLDDAYTLIAEDLLDRFLNLPPERRDLICGCVPGDTPDFIDARAVGVLLRSLADKRPSMAMLLDVPAPEFDEKLVFNGLRNGIESAIRMYSRQTSLVTDFLKNSPGLRQAIGEELKLLYSESKVTIPDHDPDAPNIRYVWMVQKLIPDAVRKYPHSERAYQDAAQVILATYFETCDVYEHPTRTYSA